MRTAKDIRSEFIRYFEDKGHRHVKSSSLVPYNDPTLLFTNAGMNQFKNVFLGIDQRDYTRATTSQKCVRAGGKHNDLETIGKTARHHTFFEMLGNFSFGDYFKKDAIHYAWTFLTKELGLPPEKLWITIYTDDDEAGELWKAETGFGDEKILRLGEKDNFWQMGDVGPCGPCSEIHFDRGEAYACDHPDGCALGVCDCDRWLEIWNLVFMQYNRDESGELTPLPRPSVDTGMGLERIASVMQGVDSNWETDLFTPLLAYVEELSDQTYHHDERGFTFRVIADHARACTFLIADGVLPSNEGRGYVLRRILRRATRLGKRIGLDKPFLYTFPAKVGQLMGDVYPEILEKQGFIEQTIRTEEERFLQTLQDGLKRVNETIAALEKKGEKTIDGPSAFMFYDTYGFPIDLTKDMAEEVGMTVDIEGFDRAMAKQREQSKGDRARVDLWDLAKRVREAYPNLAPTVFSGYDTLGGEAKVLGLLVDGEAQDYAYDATAQLIFDEVPFYAEGGGQVGDRGKLYGANGVFDVENTFKLPDGTFILAGYVDGRIDLHETLRAEVAADRRRATAKNHTATHLLHYALRELYGKDVHQAGSLVDPDHLRFDFTYDQAPTADELARLEAVINERIAAGGSVVAKNMSMDEAQEAGFMALFGEKYGDEVRTITAGGLSKELCGGTHVNDLADIGLFVITGEGSVSSGVRRIEAMTGLAAQRYLRAKADRLAAVAKTLKVNREEDLLPKLEQQEETIKALRKELAQMKAAETQKQLTDRLDQIVRIEEIEVLVDRVEAADPGELRTMADQYRDHLHSGVVVLAGVAADDKIALVAMRTADAGAQKIHAGQLIKALAERVGGKGGGRPDMAQAGGKDVAQLDAALKEVPALVQAQIER